MNTSLKIAYVFLISCILIRNPLFSADYDAIVDNDFSPFMGGQDFISGLKTLQMIEDAWILKKPPKTGWKPGILRFSELVLFWDPLNSLCATVQHEFFGHGYRIREIGEKYAGVDNYTIGWPFPYSTGGGMTEFGVSDAITATQMNAIAIAGIESEGILARQLKMKWMVDRQMDGRSATLYYNTQQALFLYALATSIDSNSFNPTDELTIKGKYPEDGNDLAMFVYWNNLMNPTTPLSEGRLLALSAFNFLDAFTLYVPYAWWIYVLEGEKVDTPMFKLKGFSYLPNYKLTLAPFGIEHNIENFFSKGDRPYYVYVKWGKNGGEYSLGAGFEGLELFSINGVNIGLKIDVWKQPSDSKSPKVIGLLLGDDVPIDFGATKTLYGMETSIISRTYLGEKGVPFYFYFEGGYKTKGFLPGYSLNSGVFWRLGLSSTF